MYKITSCLLFVFLSSCPLLHAQEIPRIESRAIIWGEVVDADTAEPVAAASIYLGHTLLGSATNSEGLFAIEKIPAGTYTLVVSRIGYKTFQQEIDVASDSTLLEFKYRLTPDVYELDGVAVKAEQPKEWQRQFELFNKLFLGTMPYEEQAQVLNPYALDFREDRNKLTAFLDELLIMENQGMGYRIHFQLMGFEWDKREDILQFTGAGYFEYLQASEERAHKIWSENRSRREGNYSWLARSNPSIEGEWKARIIKGRCKCNEYNYGTEGIGVCQCYYRGLAAPSFLGRFGDQ